MRAHGLLILGVLGLFLGTPEARAADNASDSATPSVAEAADSLTAPDSSGASDAGLSQPGIEKLRAMIGEESDPELRAAMEAQLQEMADSGHLDLRLSDAAGPSGSEAAGEHALLGPPVEGTASANPAYESVQSDPRMTDLRQAFESGKLSEDQARDRLFDILREHGIEPNNGHEWEGARESDASLSHEGQMGSEALEHSFEEHSAQMMHEYSSEALERQGASSEDGRQQELEHELERQSELAAPELEREMPSLEAQHEMSEHELPEFEAPEYGAPEMSVDHEMPEMRSEPSYEMHEGTTAPSGGN